MILISNDGYNIACKRCGSIHITAFKKLWIGTGDHETNFHYWIQCDGCKSNNDNEWTMSNMAEWDWALNNNKIKRKANSKNANSLVRYEEIDRKTTLENRIKEKEEEILQLKTMVDSI